MEPLYPVTKRFVRSTSDASHSRSRHPQNRPQIEIPIMQRLRPAGSFFGDFRTPAGARNSSRKRSVCYERQVQEKQSFVVLHSRVSISDQLRTFVG